MQKFKLILKHESFFEDLVFTLKILDSLNGKKKNDNVLLILQNTESEAKEFIQLLKENELAPHIILKNKKERSTLPKNTGRYNYIFTNLTESEITKESKNSMQQLIFLAEYPCPDSLKPLPNFNAAARPAKNYKSL